MLLLLLLLEEEVVGGCGPPLLRDAGQGTEGVGGGVVQDKGGLDAGDKRATDILIAEQHFTHLGRASTMKPVSNNTCIQRPNLLVRVTKNPFAIDFDLCTENTSL